MLQALLSSLCSGSLSRSSRLADVLDAAREAVTCSQNWKDGLINESWSLKFGSAPSENSMQASRRAEGESSGWTACRFTGVEAKSVYFYEAGVISSIYMSRRGRCWDIARPALRRSHRGVGQYDICHLGEQCTQINSSQGLCMLVGGLIDTSYGQ
jgi:hypothetical protein